MAIDLALDLTVERISLLERHSGRWHRLSNASCDASNLAAQLQKLRDLVLERRATEGGIHPTVLAVLPEEQVLYGVIPNVQGDLHGDHLRALLDGQTPYPLSAIRFDWRKRAGALQFAALPLQTLKEAETFLNSHGFMCTGVLSGKPAADFDGAPWFGRSEDAAPYSMASEVNGRTVVAIDRRKILVHLPVEKPVPSVPETVSGVPSATLERLAKATRMDPSHQQLLPDTDADLDPRAEKAVANLAARQARATQSSALKRGGMLTVALAAGLAAVAFWPQKSSETPEITPAIIRAQPAVVPASDEPPLQIAASDAVPTPPAAAVVPASVSQDDIAPQRTALPEVTRQNLPSAPNLVSDQATFYTPASVAFRSTQVGSLDVLIQPALDPEQGADALALTEVALPEAADFPDALPAPPSSDVTFAVDERGLVRPSSAGQETPEGFLVFSGSPDTAPPERPEFVVVEPPAPAPLNQAALAEDDPMRGVFPKPRPAGLAERFERASLGGKTQSELSRLRPAQRPASVTEAYALKRAAASAANALTTTAELRQASGPRPVVRPNDMARRYAASQTKPRVAPAKATAAASTAAVQSTSSAAAVTVPKIPTKASVSEQATISRAMDLARINLLGTFGSNSSPRALVRMPNGRVVSISIGDNLDGGRVASIGGGRLSYVKRGKTVTLNMPKG